MSTPRADTAQGDGDEAKPRVTPDIAAEAAVWIARLHGPGRTNRMERECLRWQALSPAHREAFERCTDTWADVPGIKLATAYETASSSRASSAQSSRDRWYGLPRWAAAVGAMGVLTVGAVLVQQWRDLGTYSTGVGEQRVVVLEDGSRVRMNTATQLHVDFEAGQRTVNVRSGEALFEVAKDALRPFVVRVAGSEVVAVGTAFSVRYTDKGSSGSDAIAVTLIEGRVDVRPAAGGRADALAPAQAVLMHAGERLKLDHSGGGAVTVTALRVDRPDVEQVTAWKRGEAVFDATALAEAVAEMNRYSRTPIVLVDGLGSSNLRVSGLYRTGDSAGFARAVAALHGLRVQETHGRLELGKAQ
jgi:transmembrane sensor